MSRPLLEVADLVRSAGTAFIERNRAWRVCPVLCVNDLDFVVGFGFVVVLGFGDGLQGKGFPLPLHSHVEEFEIALCHPTGLGHAVWPQDGEVI